ncbi:MAG: 30S ribosomal protein S6 [Acidobacteria bacterium]|nr:30S ribosomal protein S6 [Acidobacteriota bacterium]
MRTYELMVIHRPATSEDDVRSHIEEVNKAIADGGTLTTTDFWGKRRFAYEIEKVSEGFYSVFEFEGDNDLLDSLNRSLTLRDAVMRHKIVRTDED